MEFRDLFDILPKKAKRRKARASLSVGIATYNGKPKHYLVFYTGLRVKQALHLTDGKGKMGYFYPHRNGNKLFLLCATQEDMRKLRSTNQAKGERLLRWRTNGGAPFMERHVVAHFPPKLFVNWIDKELEVIVVNQDKNGFELLVNCKEESDVSPAAGARATCNTGIGML